MVLRLVSEIPSYRQQHFPAQVQMVSWEQSSRISFTNTEWTDTVIRMRAYFQHTGLQKGNSICTLSAAGHPLMLATEFALLDLGCILVPLHAALPATDMQDILGQVRPTCTIALSQDAMQQIAGLQCTGQTIALDTITLPSGTPEHDHHSPCSPDDTALIIFTSGSSGRPKGVMLSHHNVMSTVLSVLAVIPVHYRHVVLSYLPVAHILERIAIYCYLAAGVTIHFAESPRQGMALLKTIRPHYMTAVPRILDRAVSRLQQAGDTRHYFVRGILLWSLDTEAGTYGMVRSLLRKIILRPLRSSFGGRIKGILAGGAPLRVSTGRIFKAAGMSVREGYGLSECCGVATLNRFEPGGNKSGTVGLPLPGVEVKIAASPGTGAGEVWIKSAGVMQGYLGLDDETSTVLTSDGWLRTGDRGEFVEGRFLRITGRVKEQFKNAFGEYVAPSKLEQLLEQDLWIAQALVTGAGKPVTGALIVPDFELLESWCKEHGVHWTAPIYMVHNTQVLQAFEKRIAQVNATLSAHEHIRKFTLLHEPWTVENGLLTPSLKLRREVIEERYAKTIDEMYRSGVR